jgi:hypothetical protein
MADNKILDAVNQLDPNNDNHWTADGLPRLETVRLMASDSSLSRDDVEKAAPDFRRPKASEQGGQSSDQTPPAPPPAPPSGDQGQPNGDQSNGDQGAPPPPPPAPPSDQTPPPPPPAPQGQDSGVRGDLGPATPAAPLSPTLAADGGPVPPVDVDGQRLPQADANELKTDEPADGLPTARDPIMIEGARPMGLNVDDVSGRSGPGGSPTPEIAKGTTIQGFNALNSVEDDVRDALATVAPSPNAPTGLGGPLPIDEMQGVDSDGLTTPADVHQSEAQLSPLDRGRPGNPEALPMLQEALAEQQKETEELRAQADEITGRLNEAAARESEIRAAIELATPRTGVMEAIQGYFQAQDETAARQLEVQKAITESGVDLKELGRLTQRSPLDAAAKG